MNKRLLALLFGTSLIWSGGAFALGSFGVYGSYWNTKDADAPFGAGAKVRLGSVEIRGTYYEDVTADTDPDILDLEVSDTPLELGFAFNIPAVLLAPYVGAGVSYHMLDTNVADIDDEVGWYAVAGAEMGMPIGLAWMGEIMYRKIEGTVTGRNISGDVNLDLSGVTANVGLLVRF